MAQIFRAETIGSLVRPAYLNEARKKLYSGQVSLAEFKRLEDRSVDEALALQERVGLDVVTDGEMRRTQFMMPGSGTQPPSSATRTPRNVRMRRVVNGVREEHTLVSWLTPITEKIKFTGSKAVEEFAYAAAHTKKPVKITLSSPTSPLSRWTAEHSSAVYAKPAYMLADTVNAVVEEVKALKAAGCTYVQIDAPDLASIVPDQWQRERAEGNQTFELLAREGIDAVNAVASVPGVTFGLHICRGNNQGYWSSEASWEQLARLIIPRTPNYRIYLLEYDDWRSGSFEPLKEIPRDKVAVLGLISTKRAELEPAPEIVKRIEEASRFFPREQLALSAQCGFAPAAEANTQSMEGQEAKLRLIGEIARQVWG